MKVFFDFDGTLTTKDSLIPFLIYTVGWPMALLKVILLLPLLCRYLFNRELRDEVKNRALQVYLSKFSKQEIDHSASQFVTKILPKMIRPQAIALLEKHKANGDECILVSASIDLYLLPWVKQNGFVKLISTPYIGNNPTMMGKNCYGEEKVHQILKNYPDLSKEDSCAYGDTIGDIPMLKLVKTGFMWSNKEQKYLPFN